MASNIELNMTLLFSWKTYYNICFIYNFETEFLWFSFLTIYLYLDNIGCCVRQGIKKLNLYESMIFKGWFSSELCWTIF